MIDAGRTADGRRVLYDDYREGATVYTMHGVRLLQLLMLMLMLLTFLLVVVVVVVLVLIILLPFLLFQLFPPLFAHSASISMIINRSLHFVCKRRQTSKLIPLPPDRAPIYAQHII